MTHRMASSKPQVLRKPRTPAEGVFCSYSHRVCMQNCVDGHDYCSKHILEDKNASFKQCNFVSNKNNKRCPNAALRSDKRDGYCLDHSRKASAIRRKAMKRKAEVETPESLLSELEHYTPRLSGEMDLNKPKHYGDTSDSDSESDILSQGWRGDGDSDAESVDSEQEDTLKHAGVYTAQEVAYITKEKLIRLQSLYIDQFKRLQYLVKEKRRKYLQSVKRENESYGSIHLLKEDVDQKGDYNKLQALKRYRKRFGKEALLHRQSKERRIEKSEGESYKPPSYVKCVYLGNGSKCGQRAVPLAKYCLNHITEDPYQVMFKHCHFGAGTCKNMVTNVTEEGRCHLHLPLPEFVDNRLPKRQSSCESSSKEEDGNKDVPVIDVLENDDDDAQSNSYVESTETGEATETGETTATASEASEDKNDPLDDIGDLSP